MTNAQDVSNKLIVRLHKYKKPNIVYAAGTISLNEVFLSGFSGELTLFGAIEKKNLNKELFTLTCTVDSIPLEYNHQHDLERFTSTCKTSQIGISNRLETLDLFFDVAETQEESEDNEDLAQTPSPTPSYSHQGTTRNLSQMIQQKLVDVPRERKRSKENLRDSKDESKKGRIVLKRSGSRVSSVAKVVMNDDDDSTETEDTLRPYDSEENVFSMIEKEEDSRLVFLDIKKRRSMRFYEAFSKSTDGMVEDHYHFMFISDTEHMKTTLATLFSRVTTKEHPLKLLVCGSDAFASLFIRQYLDVIGRKTKQVQNAFELYMIPIGKTCEFINSTYRNGKYSSVFCSEEWDTLFATRDTLPQSISSTIYEPISDYINTADAYRTIRLGEVQLTIDEETVILPFLKSVVLTSVSYETRPPALSIDLCKQKKDKQHVTKIKKSLQALDIIRADIVKNPTKLEDKIGEMKDALLVVARKNDRKLMSCERLIQTYCDDDDKKKRVEKKDESPMKKEEKEENASISVCTKLMISCEDTYFSVFIDGRRYSRDVKYVSVKNVWSGTKTISIRTFN